VKIASAIALGLLLAAPLGCAQESLLRRLDDALSYQSPNGRFRSDLSGLVDLEAYFVDERPPGLIFGNSDFFNPRLSLFLDTHLGEQFYSLVQFRADRGFDPRLKPDGDARFDEYLLRWTPWADGRLNVQAGKFATVFGKWVQRHDSWHNPFITAPLPYENVTVMTDQVAPGGPGGFLGRRSVADTKATWIPVVWGPAYNSGASVFGQWGKFDYAFEFKNTSISSRPTAWDAQDTGWEHPTFSGRLAHTPNAAWNYGVSASHGSYLLPAAEATLPAGYGRGSYRQTTIGTDFSWSHHGWQVWGEAMVARFQVPRVGNADTFTWFLETKYKITPNLSAAVRLNQQLFDTVPDGAGGDQHWDRNIYRVDTALAYRFTRHTQAKLQYSLLHENGPIQQGEQLFAAQLTVKF
jgi:hypothetical protein